jgi:hypothetical protein
MEEKIQKLSEFVEKQYQPGRQQMEALKAIEAFLAGEKKVFLLKGYAGTGKTTLTKWLADYVNYLKIAIHLMAPTGRAARIIQMKTGYPATTIHKAIYRLDSLKEREIRKDGKIVYKFYFDLNYLDENITKWYFIDESSMISDKYTEEDFFIFGTGRLLHDIITVTAPQNHPRKIKLFFIGDDAQLPPVTDSKSGALCANYLKENFDIEVDFFTLTDVFRQEEGSGILGNATRLRRYITGGEKGFFGMNTSYPDIKMLDAIQIPVQFSESNPLLDFTKSIVLVATNNQALDYNLKIRDIIFPDAEFLQANETLMIQQNNYNYPVELFNGSLVKVLWVDGNATTKSNMKSYDAQGNECKVSHRFRWIKIEVKDENDLAVNVNCIILDSFLYSKKRSLSYEENIALYLDFKIRHPNLKPGTPEFTKELKGDPWFNALRVKYGYAVTVHKAQGGEWEEAILDMDYYSASHSLNFKRWLYTAMTRGANRLFLANMPNQNIFSKIIWKDLHNPSAPEIQNENKEILLSLPENIDKILNSLGLQKDGFLTDYYYQILAQLEGSGITIRQRKGINFCEIYTYERDGKTASVMHYYNGKNKFTRNMTYGGVASDPVLLATVINITEQPVQFTVVQKQEKTLKSHPSDLPELIRGDTMEITRDKWFEEHHKHLWQLYEALFYWSLEKEILIEDVQHEPYKELYTFSKDGAKLEVYFWFNSLHLFTAVMPKPYGAESKLLADDLAAWVVGMGRV